MVPDFGSLWLTSQSQLGRRIQSLRCVAKTLYNCTIQYLLIPILLFTREFVLLLQMRAINFAFENSTRGKERSWTLINKKHQKQALQLRVLESDKDESQQALPVLTRLEAMLQDQLGAPHLSDSKDWDL